MEDNDNPYSILGVEKNASQNDIKKRYRKLALKYHPDKQSTEDGRKEATDKFAKISNAYEILGDEQQRSNYDREATGRVNRPWSKQPRHGSGVAHDNFFHHTHFHDPFSVFESVFREEFGSDVFGSRQGFANTNNSNNARGGGSGDPFFGGGGFGGRPMFGNNPFFAGAGMPGGGSMFGNDPFFGGGAGMMPGGFGGGGGFGAMNQQMNGMMNMHQTMMRQQQQQQSHFHGNSSNPQQQQQSFVYSSTNSSNLMRGGGGGENVTTSTTTRIINGKQQVVTEHIVQKADGTVERRVERSGDDDFPGGAPQRLGGAGNIGQRQALGSQQQQQQQQEQAPPQQQQRRHQEKEQHSEEEERKPKSTSSSSSKTQRRDSKVSKGRFPFKRKRRDSSNASAEKE